MDSSNRIQELFAQGEIIRPPVASGPGYWAGAPGVFFSTQERTWYVTYRIRRPRGIEPDRGGEARIARSTDLKNWEDVWSLTKGQLGSASIERCCLHHGPDGRWRYFVSYVDEADGRWCLSVLKAQVLRQLSPANLEPVFKAQPLGLEGIKDPWITELGGTFFMFVSVALPTARTTSQSHDTLDIFNTGECISATGLATSLDLDHWQWQGIVFRPAATGWDMYCRRLNSVLPHEGQFLGFYDGSASQAENYEERTGLAVSEDLREWRTLTPDRPLCTSPYGSGSLRYLDVQPRENLVHVFYEFARHDGAHDLRLATAQASLGYDLVRCCSAPGP